MDPEALTGMPDLLVLIREKCPSLAHATDVEVAQVVVDAVEVMRHAARLMTEVAEAADEAAAAMRRAADLISGWCAIAAERPKRAGWNHPESN